MRVDILPNYFVCIPETHQDVAYLEKMGIEDCTENEVVTVTVERELPILGITSCLQIGNRQDFIRDGLIEDNE